MENDADPSHKMPGKSPWNGKSECFFNYVIFALKKKIIIKCNEILMSSPKNLLQ